MSDNQNQMSRGQFPQARLDAMTAAAASFDPRDRRLDAMSPRAMSLLQAIDPVLAYKVQTGTADKFHKDASESLFFARQLEYIRPGLFEVLFPDLEGKKFVPLETTIAPGAEIYTYRSMKKVGAAALIKQYADDPPRVDATGLESFQQIRGLAAMYGYTTQELRAAMMAQLPLDVRKAMSARYAMALLIDQIIFYGSTEGGLKGLATLSNTTSFTTPTGGQASKLWRKKTPDEMVADLHGVVNNVVKTTFGIHRPDSMLLPLAAYNLAATRRMGDGSNQTVLDFFLATSPYVKNVDPSYRLDYSQSSNWSGSTGRAIAYEKNPERIAALIPLEFEQLPPQQEHFEIRTTCHARVGGVVAFYPASVSYMDGITDSGD